MTYNFDPERWYDNEFDFMERELKQGRLTKSEFDQKVAALMKKYDDMTRRLDGTYQLPE